MVMVHQQQQQQQQHQNKSNKNDNQNGGLLKKGGGDGLWLPQNSSLRVKKPMLGGRRIIGGPSTPVPRWKLYENPFYDGIAAAAAAAAQQQQQQQSSSQGGRNVAVSARKLAATLWELQEFPFSLAAAAAASSKASTCPCAQHRSSSSSSSTAAAAAASAAAKKARSHLLVPAESNNNTDNSTAPRSPSSCQPPDHPAFFHSQQAAIAKDSVVSLQHSNKAWETVKRSSQSQSTSSRQVAAMRSHVHRLLERRADARLNRLASAQANSGPYMVLNRIQDIQEQHPPAMPSSMVAALRIELECVRTRAHELELAHKSARREIDNLLKKVTEEKMVWRNKEQENIRSAVQAVKLEAEDEKKARRRIESVNRKMSRELIDANIAVAKAVQELERERKARELMEDVCDELAREIGDDKAEVEELKRESAKVREEVEEERQMLQMAEVWREERVQMKLAEARLEIEEKNAILDHLRSELEAFLKSRKAFLHDAEEDEMSCRAAVQEAEGLKTAMDSLQLRGVQQDSCMSPGSHEEASGLYTPEQNSNNGPQPDEMGGWGWRTQSTSGYGEPDPRLETREEVIERLRRKYDQNGQHASVKGVQETDGRKSEDERGDGSEWNSQSEHQGDDTKEEDGSQWESASDEDILEAMQQNNSNQSTQDGRVGVEQQIGPQGDAAVRSSGNDSMSSYQVYSIKPSAELPSGEDLWKVSTPSAGTVYNEEQQGRLSGEGSRNLLGRGMADLSRSSHMRLVTEQGIASPSRDWRSPDRGNPHIARGIKGFIEWPKMSRENGVKGKVLESKVEKVDRRMLKQSS